MSKVKAKLQPDVIPIKLPRELIDDILELIVTDPAGAPLRANLSGWIRDAAVLRVKLVKRERARRAASAA